MKDDSVTLKQIVECIEKIDKYIVDMSFDDFSKDDKTQDAVIRNIEILGEAATRLSKEFFANHAEFPVAEAVSMRNRLIHGYDDIDLEIVWTTTQEDLPNLKSEILKIISS